MKNSQNSYITVIGAANIDIGGTPYSPLIPSDSNPGDIKISAGGVGRNIAHNLIRLGADVRLMTAVGDDPLGKDLLDYCSRIGMDTGMSFIAEGCISSIYLYIDDAEGEMNLALSDMKVCSRIDPDHIDKHADIINGSAAVVADCNLSHETLVHIHKICKVPLFIDTVSVTKTDRIKDNLKGIYAVKPNRLEAEELSGIKIDSIEDAARAADIIIDKGAENVFISLGPEGILAADSDNIFIVGRYDTDIVNTTGAGDASTAAIVWSLILHKTAGNNQGMNDHPLVRAALAANAAAALTLGSSDAVDHELTAQDVLKKIADNRSEITVIKENGSYSHK